MSKTLARLIFTVDDEDCENVTFEPSDITEAGLVLEPKESKTVMVTKTSPWRLDFEMHMEEQNCVSLT